MTRLPTDIFVSHIGINRINLGGIDIDYYETLPNTEVVDRKVFAYGVEKLVRTVIMRFQNEKEMIGFLQNLVNSGIGFTDNEKSVAYKEACSLKNRGALKGKILGC
ncbi:MAG: hypothetical protein GY806_01345 [Gammaproteobacteria bacterium]|nr:hypothetical protein [Gammaproteobacteria bacterium]